MEKTKERTQLPVPGKDQLTREFSDFQVPMTIFDSTTTIYQVAVLAYLNKFAFSQRGIFPGYGAIAQNCHCSPRKARSTISELVTMGMIEKIFRGRAKSGEFESNLYYLTGGGMAPHAIPMAQHAIPMARHATERGEGVSKPYKLNTTAYNKNQGTKTTPAPITAGAGAVQPIPLDKIKFIPNKPDVLIQNFSGKTEQDQQGMLSVGEILAQKPPTTLAKRTTMRNEGDKATNA